MKCSFFLELKVFEYMNNRLKVKLLINFKDFIIIFDKEINMYFLKYLFQVFLFVVARF